MLCAGVELAVFSVSLGFFQQVFPIKDLGFYCCFFSLGEVGLLPLNKVVCLTEALFWFFSYCCQ